MRQLEQRLRGIVRRTGVVLFALVLAWSGVGAEFGQTPLAYAHPAVPSVGAQAADHAAPRITSFQIEQGAATTRTAQVTLTVQASDAGSGLTGLGISNDGVIWSSWLPYSESAQWMLPPGAAGPRTVYARVRDGAGNVSAAARASIVLDPSGAGRTTEAVVAAPTTPAAAISCSPRPRISVQSELALTIADEGGALLVTVSTTGEGNSIQAIRFDGFSNALVAVDGPTKFSAPFTYTMPAGQQVTRLRFGVWKQSRGQAATVRLTVVDGCGEWTTFVGGGASAF